MWPCLLGVSESCGIKRLLLFVVFVLRDTFYSDTVAARLVSDLIIEYFSKFGT